MTFAERRAVLSLASIMSLRMLGLFMILPVFSLYAEHLSQATPFLIGLAVGIYGLTQGLLQIPFGMISDYFGRKKVIFFGLCLFAIGSMTAALSHSILGVIIGRALQGSGAVGSTIIALVSDLTSVQNRTKAMAIIGIMIGLSFSLAFILGPLLVTVINVNGIFWLTSGFSLIALVLLLVLVPNVTQDSTTSALQPRSFIKILTHPELFPLNAGIFILHAILTATFVVIPLNLNQNFGLASTQQWLLYLPMLILAFSLTIPLIILTEKKNALHKVFLGAVITLSVCELSLWLFADKLSIVIISLLLFFTAFSLLEAFLPSLVSKTAPIQQKGTALGIYSSAQFLGIFVGGSIGGWLYGKFQLTDVYLFCLIITIMWVIIATKMKKPPQS